ncbi:MAG TPA: LamG domain-containing protein [Polyangia bacterium]|nr:LamG domain-containing protein [Polyangia bacterium]
MSSDSFARTWLLSITVVLGLALGSGCSGSNGGPVSGAGGSAGSQASGGASGSGTGGSGVGGSTGTGGATGTDASVDTGPGNVDARDAGGQADAAGTGGAGGAQSCAGRAVNFGANVPGNNDPAKARVIVDFGASADLPVGNARRTIEFWAFVRASSWAGDANTMFFYGTNNRVADGFGLDFGGVSATIDPFTNAIFDNDNQPSGVVATTDQWVHFAMTWDQTAVRAFVNGVEKATKMATGTQMLMTGRTPVTIGGYDPAYFNGQIDEFRIWNVARTAPEITSTMHQTLTGMEAGLVGYWKFDETTGTTATDSTMTTGHTAHPGTLMATSPASLPTFVTSTAPINCP